MKSLIIPVVTPPGIPSESQIYDVLETETITRYGPEGAVWEESAPGGAPRSFHNACRELMHTFSGLAKGVLVGGTTGEGTGLGGTQYSVLLAAMKKACPQDMHIYAGILGGDTMVGYQVRTAQSEGIDTMVLGLGHTANNTLRFQAAMKALNTAGKLFLYTLPTFRPADKGFILTCLEDSRVVGFKDSSGDAEFFSWLLSLKERRPDFQVYHGDEGAYGELSDDDLGRVDGLVAGSANIHTALLAEYTKTPRDPVISHARSALHKRIMGLSGRTGNSSVPTIERYIHGLKRRLVELNIFPHGQDALLSYQSGSLFKTYQG